MFFSRRLFQAVVASTHSAPSKVSTGLTGVKVHPNPLPTLRDTYHSNLQLIRSFPETSVYRQSLEALLSRKLKILQDTFDKDGPGDAGIARIESDIGDGLQIEQVIMAAEDELNLSQKMLKWQAYVSLYGLPSLH